MLEGKNLECRLLRLLRLLMLEPLCMTAPYCFLRKCTVRYAGALTDDEKNKSTINVSKKGRARQSWNGTMTCKPISKTVKLAMKRLPPKIACRVERSEMAGCLG